MVTTRGGWATHARDRLRSRRLIK